jgi:site-specific recombinase XerD
MKPRPRLSSRLWGTFEANSITRGSETLIDRLHPQSMDAAQRVEDVEFRHSRVTLLRKLGTPADLQRQWIGHSSLKTTDRYSHTDQELEFRRNAANRVGLDLIVGPKFANWTQ